MNQPNKAFKYSLLSTFLIFVSGFIYGQIIPEENSSLNYRFVGFSVPPGSNNCTSYILEISMGTWNSEKEFEKNIIIRQKTANNRLIKELPLFGEKYTWRIICQGGRGKNYNTSELHHFQIATSPFIDTSEYRLKIISNTITKKDILILTDKPAVIYDLKGQPVWFLPHKVGIYEGGTEIRDFKPTTRGTFTFLVGMNGYEVDYNGNIIWTTSSIKQGNDSAFHHEFTRLSNGHYLTAGEENIVIKPRSKNGDERGPEPVPYGTIIELDAAGNVIWHWKSAQYFLDPQLSPFKQDIFATRPHLNSLYFDEDESVIYAGFKNISSILKIAYPSGKILADYTQYGDSVLFWQQHSVNVNKSGQIYLYSNNTPPKEGEIPSAITILDQLPGQRLKTNWQFNCDIDQAAPGNSAGGGSIQELADRSLLCSMGVVNRIFIVNRDKKVLWNALSEHFNCKEWEAQQQYRVNTIEDISNLNSFIFR